MLHFSTPPKNICILRLSAIGDICHSLPVIRTIQNQWPNTKITWVIGKVEYELLKGINDIDFIVFDKKAGITEYLKIRSQLGHINFDVLLHMQVSLRASLISIFIKAKFKIGFDKPRAKDGQWLFTNTKISHIPHQHVLDSLFGFSATLGITDKKLTWNIPISEQERISARNKLNNISNYAIISPCSSKAYRNWHSLGYSAVADFIKERYNLDVVLSGGTSQIEHDYGNKIVEHSQYKPLNLIGKTTLKELLSIIENATFVITPDSGPAHMSTAMGTPVIGLYATTNPERARPYLSSKWVVNHYPDAIKMKHNKEVSDVAWGTRIRDDWAMNLITIEDVTNMVDDFMQQLTTPQN